MLIPGQRLFEYEIIRLIGQGGFAIVYEARDRMLERRVAIKQLRL
jgi:serine/threonine protein kinase